RTAFRDTLKRTHRAMQRRTSGQPLKRRTGQLARSIKTRMEGNRLGNLRGVVYTDPSVAPYAGVQETGATIRAKDAYAYLPGGPYLAIPTDENKTPAGVTRRTPREVHQNGGFVAPITAPKANYAVFQEDWLPDSHTVDLTPMFWLVRQVTIPPRLGMRETTEEEIPTLLSDLSGMIEDNLRDRDFG
ncbi:MAG TPA: hypothetical protein VKA64_11140, partial [Gammaproteobacteria bacterium]|nr:hypothetical protein [Gammaproteobacteria bacterium]